MLLHHLIQQSANTSPAAPAVKDTHGEISYETLARQISGAAAGLLALGLDRGERVAFYMDKRIEAVVAAFGAAAAGGLFVPINPLLKPEQVAYILRDCGVRFLVTTPERLSILAPVLPHCPALQHVIVVGAVEQSASIPPIQIHPWSALASAPAHPGHRIVDADRAAILYTSGSSGKPKGVVLSHRNLVAGAESVAQYLENHCGDRILALLPLSFDYGLNQLTTAFKVGACAVLMNYLLPRDVIRMVEREQITGLAAVPPLWVQLAQLDWPTGIDQHLRYITNSGGHLPKPTLDALRAKLPHTKPYLMYGLTEAFRSTYLPPEEVERRPDSIGKAIPNAEIMVVREDGTPCAPGEEGELVHRGVHVTLGYWNDPEKTAECYKPVPGQADGLPNPELAVWSGDTVKMDDEGFLYFIGRRDEMIKTSGYRVSPTEVEEVVYATELVTEAAAIGVPHPVLGQAVVLLVYLSGEGRKVNGVGMQKQLLAACKQQLPAFMVPAQIVMCDTLLPRNPNGKIDRRALAQEHQQLFRGAAP